MKEGNQGLNLNGKVNRGIKKGLLKVKVTKKLMNILELGENCETVEFLSVSATFFLFKIDSEKNYFLK